MTYGVAGPARQIAVGEISSRGLLPFTGPQCLNGADPNKKTPVLHCPLYFQGAAAGIRSNIFTIRFFAQMRQDARKTIFNPGSGMSRRARAGRRVG